MVLATASLAPAETIVWSLGLNAVSPAQDGANLAASTVITPTNLITLGISAEDYGPHPAGGLVPVDSTFDGFLAGTYSDLPGFDLTSSSLRMSLNQSGSAISGAVTLNSPPLSSSVPEPATMAALGLALIALALLSRRKLAR
jgi:hypothetical protein